MAASENTTGVTDFFYRPNLNQGAQIGGVWAPLPLIAYKQIDFADLGSGASDSIDFDSALDDIIFRLAWAQNNTAWVDSNTDLAFIMGESGGDTNGLLESTTLHGTGTGLLYGTKGDDCDVGVGSSYTPAVGFTGTELDGVSAGDAYFCVMYHQLELIPT